MGGEVDLGVGYLLRQSMEPVGLLLAEDAEELLAPPSPPGFLRFLLDSLLHRESV